MELLLLIVLIVAVVALVRGIGGPSWYGRRPGRRVVSETVYEDDPVVVEEVVEEEPVSRGRRRIVEY